MRLRPSVLILLSLLPAACSTTSHTVPDAWLSVPQAPRYRVMSLDDDGRVHPRFGELPSRLTDGPIHTVTSSDGTRIYNGEKPITEPFAEVESLSYSAARGEVAFSVRRDTGFDRGFDIGLVSSDASPISWVPNDPADEVDVQWAPRGSKISYVLRASGGDAVRTLHVPTSYQFVVPFPGATIHALVWEPKAERYAVAYSTVDASDRIATVKYDGTDRAMAIDAAARVDADVLPFSEGAVLLRPRDVGYREKMPVVVWMADDFAWSDARARLMNDARVAMIVTKAGLTDALWKEVAGTPWMDGARVFVVDARTTRGTKRAEPSARYILITPDAALPSVQYRVAGGVVSAAPAVVQSVSAGFIADHLKRTTPTNATSR